MGNHPREPLDPVLRWRGASPRPPRCIDWTAGEVTLRWSWRGWPPRGAQGRFGRRAEPKRAEGYFGRRCIDRPAQPPGPGRPGQDARPGHGAPAALLPPSRSSSLPPALPGPTSVLAAPTPPTPFLHSASVPCHPLLELPPPPVCRCPHPWSTLPALILFYLPVLGYHPPQEQQGSARGFGLREIINSVTVRIGKDPAKPRETPRHPATPQPRPKAARLGRTKLCLFYLRPSV